MECHLRPEISVAKGVAFCRKYDEPSGPKHLSAQNDRVVHQDEVPLVSQYRVCERYFKQYLEPEIWQAYESTYSSANIEKSWDAFFNAVGLFAKLGRTIGAALGYDYPMQM